MRLQVSDESRLACQVSMRLLHLLALLLLLLLQLLNCAVLLLQSIMAAKVSTVITCDTSS